jgi:hypothetical protein
VFALADFVPTQRFAALMGALLMLAVIGDLVFLPAILLSPLGRYFRHAEDRTETQLSPAIAPVERLRFSPPHAPAAVRVDAGIQETVVVGNAREEP